MKILSFNIMLLLFNFYASCQQQLSLNEAIAIGLKNNYNIAIAKNNLIISKNDNTNGHAGMLPSLTFNSSFNRSGNNTSQQFSTGPDVDKNGARSDNLNATIELKWTLFDGMKMFIAKDKFQENETANAIQLKLQIENTIVAIIYAYYDIVRQNKIVNNHQIVLSLYEERLKIAKAKFEIGNGPKSDYIQAQLDYNIQKTDRIKLEAVLSELKTKLNLVISRPAEMEYDVTDEIVVDKNISLNEITNLAMKNNFSILYQHSNIRLNEFDLEEIKTELYPQVFFNAGYNFSRTKNQVGFLLYNQNLGWNTGLSASWSIFNGFNVQREKENANIRIINAKLQLDQVKNDIQSSVINGYRKYKSALESLELEEVNINLAKENLDIILERFRLGKSNTLELKDAQKTHEDVLTRLQQSLYEAKLAETELLKLKGELVK